MIQNTTFFLTLFLALCIVSAYPTGALAQTTVFNTEKDVWAWKGDNYVSVMWESYGDHIYYDAYRRSADNGNTQKINNEPLNNTGITDTEPSLSGDYEYYVEVSDEDHRLLYRTGPVHVRDIVHSGQRDRDLTQTSQTITEQRQHITTDLEFRNFLAMTGENIQNFLDYTNSFLADFVTEDATGTERTAAGIIFNAANEYGINPQAIITTLQKEQALISTLPGDATQYQLDWAMGYAVGNDAYRGFGKQVDRAAWQFDKYYRDMETTGTTVSGWGVLIAKETEDCLVITPRNMATAALYTYTPLSGAGWGGCTPFGGNFLYWDLFYNRYKFDAGPEGDFEVSEPEDSVGCSIVRENNPLNSLFNLILVVLPVGFIIVRLKQIKSD